MADEFTDWEPVESGLAPGTVKNRLPNQSLATVFQYRKYFDIIYPFGAIAAGSAGATVRGKTHIRLLAPGGMVLIEQIVEYRFGVVVQEFGGGVGDFLWYPLDGGDGRISTSIVNGVEVPKDADGNYEGWRYTDRDNPTIYSEEGDLRIGDPETTGDDIDASSEFTLNGGRIWGAWQSPAYRISIPPGSILDVVKDEWQVGRLREATYHFRFLESSGIGRFLDHTGALRLVLPGNNNLSIAHRYMRPDRVERLSRRAILTGKSQGQICYTDDGVGHLIALDATVGRYWQTQDQGHTWDIATSKGVDVVVFGSGFSLLDIAPDGKGGWFALGLKDGLLYLQHGPRPYDANRTVGKAIEGTYRLAVQAGRENDGAVVICGATHEYRSDNEFMTPPKEQGVAE